MTKILKSKEEAASLLKKRNPLRLLPKISHLKTAYALATAGDWDGLLARDLEHHMIEASPATLPLVLLAALERENETHIARVAARASTPGIKPDLSLAVAKHLLSWNRPEQAWQVLKAMDHSQPSNRLIALCHRVALKAKDPAVIGDAWRAHRVLLGQENDHPPPDGTTVLERVATPAPYSFPGKAAASLPPAGNLTILQRTGLPVLHKKIHQELLTKLDRVIAERPEPRVFYLDDVFVSRLGQIWKPDGTILLGTRTLPPKSEWKTVPELENGVLASKATKGFFHWYAEHVSALAWRLGTDVPQFPILLGSHAAKFCDQTLRLAGCKAEEITRFETVRCRRLYVTQAGLMSLSDWPRFAPAYEAITAAAARESPDTNLPPYIYISRRDSNRRVMQNEAELEAALRAIGIEPVIMSERSLAQQVNLTHNARLLMGPHGAGLTHLINGKPGLKVLEIMPVQHGQHSLRFNFARLSRMRGHDHTMWLEPINPISGNWSVDIPSIVALAQNMLNAVQ